mgnify:CR=1 FL=1
MFFPQVLIFPDDVCSSLFGSTSILTLTTSEVWLCVVVSVIVVALFTVFYHKIFAVTFDEILQKLLEPGQICTIF